MVRRLGEHGVRVLVIDDNSPDGTGEIADGLAAELDYVSVLHRPQKEGLGPAYIAGFQRALVDGADLILEMDCDFSHNPDDVPKLIAATSEARLRARLALRPRWRHRELGALPPLRLARRLRLRAGAPRGSASATSRAASSVSGARCSRRCRSTRSTRRATHSRSKRRIGLCGRASRSREVPIVFVDRVEGGSKMSGTIVLEAIWKVPALRLAALRGKLD